MNPEEQALASKLLAEATTSPGLKHRSDLLTDYLILMKAVEYRTRVARTPWYSFPDTRPYETFYSPVYQGPTCTNTP